MITLFLIILFATLLSTIATYIVYKFIVVSRVKIPRAPQLSLVGNTSSTNNETGPIPAIIWSYWHELPAPELVQRCQHNWQRMAPNHDIRILHKHNVRDWISQSTIPAYFHHLPAYRQADWLRLQLLAEHGGIWIDASIILTQSLAWVHSTQQQHRSEYVGFFIQQFTQHPGKPIIENWFMAAIPNSVFIKDLAQEFNRALAMGETAYLTEITQQGRFDNIVQLIAPKKLHTYLIMHVAASALLEQAVEKYRLALFRAEDTAFAFHTRLNWSKRTLHFKLALTPCPKDLPVIIKLRGGERDQIGKYLAKGLYYRGSLLAKLLDL